MKLHSSTFQENRPLTGRYERRTGAATFKVVPTIFSDLRESTGRQDLSGRRLEA